MIQAKDLRIGNLVILDWDGDKRPQKIAEINRTNFEVEDWDEQFDAFNLYPIPLTPEMLEKSQFTKYEWMNGYFIKCASKYLMIQFYQDGILVYFTTISKDLQGHKMYGRNYFMTNKSPNNVKYLHQLQNLYYALTGEELSITI